MKIIYRFFFFLICAGVGFSQTHFTAKLDGNQENPAVETEASGTGIFVLTDAGLEFTITVEGLEFTAAHFHNGAAGSNGGVARTLTADFNGNTASGIWTNSDSEPLTPELIADLIAGNLYINVHTAANPSGEIRGQVNLSSGTSFTAKLDGNQQNPAVTTDANGTGSFVLTDVGLAFHITVDGLEMSAAHFHNAATGSNGGVVRGLDDDFNGNTAAGIWSSDDAQPLTPELIKDLLLGNIYVNVHTAANPGGEIRGQVNLSSGIAFSADLTGAQQNPPVTTEASGTGFFILTDAGLVFTITVQGLEFSAAHIHNAAVGSNGGVVRGFDEEIDGTNTISGVWTSEDTQPLTPALITELLAGNLYVNFHTDANPGGEIRGQVNLNSGATFTARLDGTQQNPSVETDASGTGYFVLTDAGLVFNITVNGLEFTAAHFHNASIGANGGVVRGFDNDIDGNMVSGIWTSSDAQPLTPELIADLFAGNIYVNFHTSDNPGGEIRGQVNLSSGTSFSAKLTGEQQNPAVTTDATGTGSFVLTEAGLVFRITVSGLEFSAAHFHNATTGANGGVVRGFDNDINGNLVSGVWTSTDTQPLTPELIADLLAGNLYVNFHTADNPGGEIRGQVLLDSGWGFSANLDGNQQNPPVITAASGSGAFTLTDAGLVFAITVAGLDFSAAHFHNAPAGTNGGVVRGLDEDFNGNTASGVWMAGDSQALTPELISELVNSNIYVNVHTAANPGGEIRGQLGGAEIVTSVRKLDDNTEIPDGFALHQNYPNPFNPSTSISFELPNDGKVKLSVYNNLGQLVQVLVNEDLASGQYEAVWDGRDFNGNALASGLYFYQLKTSGFTKTAQMTLIK